MYKKLPLVVLICFLKFGAFAQTFSVSFPDTIVYGPAIDSTSLSCWIDDYVTNLDSKSIALDVVRVQNVNAPGWKSAFCFQSCALPTTDSIRAYLSPFEIVNIAFHFEITGIPDSSTALMKFKNVDDPTEVFYQRFYGISQSTIGLNKIKPVAMAKLFPNPITLGNALHINLPESNQVNLTLRDLSGRIVHTEKLVRQSNSINLPALVSGSYIYTLVGTSINDSGILILTE